MGSVLTPAPRLWRGVSICWHLGVHSVRDELAVTRFNGLSTSAAAFAYEAAGLKIMPLAGVERTPEGLQCSCFLGSRCPSPAKHAKVPWGPASSFQTDPFTWFTVANWWHPEFGWWPTGNIGL